MTDSGVAFSSGDTLKNPTFDMSIKDSSANLNRMVYSKVASKFQYITWAPNFPILHCLEDVLTRPKSKKSQPNDTTTDEVTGCFESLAILSKYYKHDP